MRTHFIPVDKGREVAYFPDVKRFFIVNAKAKALIVDIQNGKALEEIEILYDISREQLKKYVDSMSQMSNSRTTGDACSENCNRNSKILRRLVIHLSNDCNLRCVYCYANGGVYASDSSLLSTNMLDRILDAFFSEYDEIPLVQFFGGEPLLNLDLLEYACKRICEINSNKGTETRFGIVINGTLICDRFIKLVRQYGIRVTVSYDGDPLVNDMLRVYPDGHGTTKDILSNTKWLKEETGEPNTIEVTYTKYHVDNNISVLDVVRHITEQFPGTFVHLVPAGGLENSCYTVNNLSIFADSIREICRDLKMHPDKSVFSYSLADRVFNALIHKDSVSSRYICDAGFGTLSVSVKGDVYPCFMFTDESSLNLGSVLDPELFNSEKFKDTTSKFFEFSDKFVNPKCKDCFINTLCNGCLGLNRFLSGDPLVLSDDVCNMFRRMTEEAIIGLTMMYEEKKRI